MQVMKKIFSGVNKFLENMTKIINQNLSLEEERMIKRPKGANRFFEKIEKKNILAPKKEKMKIKREIYEHKGSAHKGKGKINTDTSTFNRARKDIPSGREV